MNSTLVVIFAIIIFKALALVLVDMLDKRYRPPNINCILAVKINYPKARMLMLACGIVFIVWLTIALFFLSVVLASTDPSHIPESLPATALSVLLYALPTLTVLYFGLSVFLRCSKCHRSILNESSTKVPHVEPYLCMDGWSSVVLRALFKSQFRCMHCGQRYSIKRPSKKDPRR